MTVRLFQHDAYLRECTTRVSARHPAGAGRWALALAATVFYPGTGGQPVDRGLIAGLPVVDVREDEGEIWHLLEVRPDVRVPAPGDAVSAAIEWDRRYDHMQQHTGQHILSQAFLRALDAPTTAVHMDRSCTLDLALASLDAAGAGRAEDLANSVVAEHRPVRVTEVDPETAPSLGLRRPPAHAGRLRIVDVEGFDRSACGGTHVRTSGEAGPIAVRGWERYKGGVRVEFLCGGRALRDYRRARGLLRDLSLHLGTGEADLDAAVARLQARSRGLERDLDAARGALIDQEAERLLAGASGSPRIVAVAYPDRSIEDLRGLARALTARPACVAILAAGAEHHLLVARSADVAMDAASVVRAALAAFGGRGGGRAAAAEGAAPSAASASAVVDAARHAVREYLEP